MPIEGPLRELGIHDVFQLLDLSRKTGVLRVTSELRHNAGTISFEGGAIIFAEIRSNPHPLGALLLRTGKIGEADLERARDMQERQGDGRRLGEILVSLGALTPRELERQVRFQIEEVVFEVMSWREGYFSFSEGTPTELPTDAVVRIPTEALLMEGARRIDEWSRIEGRIPHLGVVPMLAPPQEASEGELDLLPPEWEMLAMINGVRDVRAIASELGRSDFEVAKTLFGLESAGVIVLADPGTTKRERTTLAADLAELVARAEDALARRDFEQARGVAQQAAGVHPHDPTVHLLLGRIADACLTRSRPCPPSSRRTRTVSSSYGSGSCCARRGTSTPPTGSPSRGSSAIRTSRTRTTCSRASSSTSTTTSARSTSGTWRSASPPITWEP